MSGKHALRITPKRQRQLLRLYRAGSQGEPVLTAPFPSLLVAWGLADWISDPSRVLSERVILNDRGRAVVETLILPKGS